MRIALFVTCVNDLMFPDTGKAVVTDAGTARSPVEFPLEQSCCGQMHANSGYRAEALPLVGRFVDTFAAYDAIVAPSGVVRGDGPGELPPAGPVRPGLAAGSPTSRHAPTSCPSCWSTCSG